MSCTKAKGIKIADLSENSYEKHGLAGQAAENIDNAVLVNTIGVENPFPEKPELKASVGWVTCYPRG